MAIKTRTGADGPHVATALVVFQCLIIVVMTAVARYHPYADAKDNRNSALSHQGGFQLGLDERELYKFYIMFQDVHVMIFAGFGFLMSFLKRYGYSSTGFTLLLGALMVQWGILCHGFFRLDPLDHKIPISIESSTHLYFDLSGQDLRHGENQSVLGTNLLKINARALYNQKQSDHFVWLFLLSADVATAAILISMGAVLGKTTPLQLLIMGFIEMIVFTANEYLGVEVFKKAEINRQKVHCVDHMTPSIRKCRHHLHQHVAAACVGTAHLRADTMELVAYHRRQRSNRDPTRCVSLQAVDAGGSMYVHVFGAYFGLAVSLALGHGKVIAKSEGEDSKEGSSYTSDIFAMIGELREVGPSNSREGSGTPLQNPLHFYTLDDKKAVQCVRLSPVATIFLWLFWPSFNAGLSTGDDKHRAVINTYLSLASCCVMAFATSAVVNKDNKFDMVHIQNSTLAGGVAVGTVCDLMIQPFGAVLIGMLAGVVSVLGYRFLQVYHHHKPATSIYLVLLYTRLDTLLHELSLAFQPYLLSLVHLHDTCGVNNLHGIPGVMSGVMGAVVAGLATEKDYNYSLYQQFPARMPPANSSDYWEYAAHLGGDVNPGVGRSASGQAGYQLLALSVTFVVAWVSGALTGTQWGVGGCLETPRSGVGYE
uniref:Ammonium transporter AmtB-like domain-containing protein n=1 Tax=Timema shepardi TaxID=629360 RepID=A0A7R9AR72_TIMSH|nr:unnamed protein product [Timema shepardi]